MCAVGGMNLEQDVPKFALPVHQWIECQCAYVHVYHMDTWADWFNCWDTIFSVVFNLVQDLNWWSKPCLMKWYGDAIGKWGWLYSNNLTESEDFLLVGLLHASNFWFSFSCEPYRYTRHWGGHMLTTLSTKWLVNVRGNDAVKSFLHLVNSLHLM